MRCVHCQAGELIERTSANEVVFRGEVLQINDYESAQCPNCREEFVLPAQHRRNDRRIADARRVRDGLLPSVHIAQLRASLDLTQATASALFGGGPNSFAKYESGEVIQSVGMDRLIRLIRDYPAHVSDLERYAAGIAAPQTVLIAFSPDDTTGRRYAFNTNTRRRVEVDQTDSPDQLVTFA